MHGRGEKSAAVTKYGISPISLSSWIKAAGGPVSTGKKRCRKASSKNVSKKVNEVAAKGGDFRASSKSLEPLPVKSTKLNPISASCVQSSNRWKQRCEKVDLHVPIKVQSE